MQEEEKLKMMKEQYKLLKELIEYLEMQNIANIDNIASMLQMIDRILNNYSYVLDVLRVSIDMLTIDLVDLTQQDVFDRNAAQELISNFIARWNRIAINIKQTYGF